MTDEAVRKTEEKKTPALETETSSLFPVWRVILFPKMYKTLSISGSPEMFFFDSLYFGAKEEVVRRGTARSGARSRGQ